jgi:hypothetical protein
MINKKQGLENSKTLFSLYKIGAEGGTSYGINDFSNLLIYMRIET